MYTIKKLATLAHISTRALRYYDEIDLLKPTSYTDSEYRLYDNDAVDRLQHILFYKAMGISLKTIKDILDGEDFNPEEALLHHKASLEKEKVRLETLIHTIDKTLSNMKGDYDMTDKEKFEGLKEKMISEHEEKYGEESRELYGDKVDASIKKIRGMSEKEMNDLDALAIEMQNAFIEAYEIGDPTTELSMKACDMHKEWLSHYWNFYSKEAHLGLVTMYVEDERFKTYYDKLKEGLSDFMLKAMKEYLK